MKKLNFLVAMLVSGLLFAQPTTNAPTPIARNAGDVISIYGDTYASISGVNYNPGWGQTGAVNTTYDPGTGNVVLAYTNFNYQGTDFAGNAQNASAMEFIHIDIWTSNATNVRFSPINNGTGVGEILVPVTLVNGGWSSVDIPKSAFAGMTWNSVFQLKFDGQAGTNPSDIYLDNIYFWKNPTATGTDATLSDLKIDGTTIPGFASSVYNYSYGVPGGAAIPQITLATPTDANATVTSIVQASAVPGNATVNVRAANGTTTATYTISYFVSSPATAAPTPTHTNVISMFSDAYTNVTVDTWLTGWSQATLTDVTVVGNNTKRYTNMGFSGIETVASPINAGAMTYLHLDVWTPNVTTLGVKLVDFKGDGFQGANGDTEANLNLPLASGQWVQLHIPLVDFANAGMTQRIDINQLVLTSTPFGSGTLFVDNVYFTTQPMNSGGPSAPTTNAPNPPARNAADYISIYGDTYTNISGVNYNPGWGQTGAVNTTYDPGTGNVVMAYTNFNYQGTDFASNAQNASAMEFIHIDIWTSNATNVRFSPIDNSGTGVGEILVPVTLVNGGWSSVDIPKSAFAGMTWNSVFQLKFDGQAGTNPSDIYLDNIYFWKTPTPLGTDATLSDLKVDGITVPAFAPSAYSYSYGVPGGSATPQITLATTNDPNATVTSIVQATTVPGTATVNVRAANGTTTATYTVTFFYSSPMAPAPNPVNVNVISMFSDVYTNVNVDSWRTGWSQADLTDVVISGNNNKRYTNLGFVGIETTTNPLNVSAMTYLHMDIWTPNITAFNVKLVDFKGDGFQGANGDTEANISFTPTLGQWVQLHIPLADFASAGLTQNTDINQLIFTSSTPFGSGILFVDNVYYTNELMNSVDGAITTEANIFPNPVVAGGMLISDGDVVNIELFDMSGRMVLSNEGSTISTLGLPSGMYSARMTKTNGKLALSKVVVQ